MRLTSRRPRSSESLILSLGAAVNKPFEKLRPGIPKQGLISLPQAPSALTSRGEEGKDNQGTEE